MKFDNLIKIILEENDIINSSNIVIVGGLHGDETAGNLAANLFKNKKGITVINNINTSGKRRLNGKDINRHFDVDNSTDLNDSILAQVLEHNPRIVIDLHEDVDARGVYVYCSKELSSEVKQILKEYELPLAKSACGDKVSDGVVDHGELPTKGTLEKALSKRNIPYCTLETPTKWELEKRVEVLKLLVVNIIKSLEDKLMDYINVN